MKEFIEVPFGAKDSELGGWEYTIPEGYIASIENGKIIVKKEESEDERIRKAILEHIQLCTESIPDRDKFIAWLEKQGEKSVDKLKVSDELYEHIRNTCARIDDAISSETLVDVTDYLSMAERSAQSAFDMIEKQDEKKGNKSC